MTLLYMTNLTVVAAVRCQVEGLHRLCWRWRFLMAGKLLVMMLSAASTTLCSDFLLLATPISDYHADHQLAH